MLTSQGVFTDAELKSRYEITLENYCKTVVIEANTMAAMVKTEILPAVEAYTAKVAKSAAAKKALDGTLACAYEKQLVKKLSALTDTIAAKTEELEKAVLALANTESIGEEADAIRDSVRKRSPQKTIGLSRPTATFCSA